MKIDDDNACEIIEEVSDQTSINSKEVFLIEIDFGNRTDKNTFN